MIASLAVSLIFTLTIHLSCQQTSLLKTTPSKELTFCLSKPTTSNTIQTFWHEAAGDCALEPKRLIDLYKQLTKQDDSTEDRCTLLVIHEIRKNMILAVSQQLAEAFITQQTLRENRELNSLLEEIHGTDKRILEAIWQRTLDEMHLFVEQEKIIHEILQLKSEEIQVFALQSLLNKSQSSFQGTQSILPLLTYALSKLINSKTLHSTSLDQLSVFYHQLPQELRVVYSATKTSTVGLLNRAYWEYLYAPRDNGPDSDRRIPLTWSKEKNSTDTDGHFLVEFNATGLIAFGSRFGAAPKFLYADDDRAAYFWIGPGTKTSQQWWQVIWPHDSHSMELDRAMAFQNYDTKEFLCATTPYDENRRYVVLTKGRDSAQRPECQWLVKGF